MPGIQPQAAEIGMRKRRSLLICATGDHDHRITFQYAGFGRVLLENRVEERLIDRNFRRIHAIFKPIAIILAHLRREHHAVAAFSCGLNIDFEEIVNR
ncbi:hypothetical protein D3C78_1445490 [compost metagenome]